MNLRTFGVRFGDDHLSAMLDADAVIQMNLRTFGVRFSQGMTTFNGERPTWRAAG